MQVQQMVTQPISHFDREVEMASRAHGKKKIILAKEEIVRIARSMANNTKTTHSSYRTKNRRTLQFTLYMNSYNVTVTIGYKYQPNYYSNLIGKVDCFRLNCEFGPATNSTNFVQMLLFLFLDLSFLFLVARVGKLAINNKTLLADNGMGGARRTGRTGKPHFIFNASMFP
jgi:hypothetical protein